MKWLFSLLIRYRLWRDREKPLPTPYLSYEQTIGRIKRKPVNVEILEYPTYKRSFNLKKIREGVYAGNIDVRTPSNEEFFVCEDRVAVMKKLIRKNKKWI